MPADTELSEREREILRLVATGASNKQIAQALYISANTVKVHLRNIFSKIGVVSRTEATLYAIREGIAPPPAGTAGSVNGNEVDGEEIQETGLAEAVAASEPAPLPLPQRLLQRRKAVVLLSLVLLVTLGAAGIGLRSLFWQPKEQLPAAVPSLSRWETRAPLPEGRAGLAAAVYENRIYAISGETEDGPSGEVTRYDPSLDTWEVLTSKPLPVTDVNGVLLGEKIYVPGGETASGVPTNTMEVYDPRRDAWEQKASLPVPVSGYALVAIEGKMYLFGGWDGEQVLASVYAYDPAVDEWVERTSMPTARAYTGAAVAGGKVFVVGGWDGKQALAANEVYYPQRDGGGEQAWEISEPLPEGRYGMGVIGLAENIYLYGGVTEGLPLLVNVLTNNQWQPIQDPSIKHMSRTGMVSLSGQLYFLGGLDQGVWTPQVDAYQAIYTVGFPIIQDQ